MLLQADPVSFWNFFYSGTFLILMLLAIKSRRRLNNEWGEESEIEVKIQVHMVSLLSQYVIFNRFLRIKSIFFSFIFFYREENGRIVSRLWYLYHPFFQSALRDLTFKALSSMKTIKLKENHLNPNALCAICLELFNKKQVCFKCLYFTIYTYVH